MRIRAWRPRYCDDGTCLYSQWRFVGRFGAEHRRFSGGEQSYCPDAGIPTHITNPTAVMASAHIKPWILITRLKANPPKPDRISAGPPAFNIG